MQLALQKWERGDLKGLLHEALSEWHKLAILRGRKAALLSSFLVSWEMEAEARQGFKWLQETSSRWVCSTPATQHGGVSRSSMHGNGARSRAGRPCSWRYRSRIPSS